MRLAIQDRMLPGDSLKARLEFAASLGVTGVEFSGDGLAKHVPEIIEILHETGLLVSAVNIGCTQLIHPDFDERDKAIVAIREGMANQLDLEASGTLFLPHCIDTPRLPDLHPYKSPLELEAELFVKQLKTTLLDLAYAMGAMLFLPVVSDSETHLVNSIERALIILEKSGHHPHMKMAIDVFQPSEILHNHLDKIGYIRLTKYDEGVVATLLSILKANAYDGWFVIACDADVNLIRGLL